MMGATPALRALLEGLIDYAGLFPPAKLDMVATVRNYAKYSAQCESWMLGRLIVPVARLAEFEKAQHELGVSASRGPWRISALTADAGTEGFAADIDRIIQFNQAHADRDAVIDVIEVKAAAARAIDAAIEATPEGLYPYFELPVQQDVRGLVASLAGSECGAKVRTGGLTADLYPSPAQLAAFIHACLAAGVPFKATAGMHHPIRHFSETVKTREHGFINVFMATAIARVHRLPVSAVETMLSEERPAAFRFDAAGCSYGSWRITSDDVRTARERAARSFGSCSFDEPRADLAALNLLEMSAT